MTNTLIFVDFATDDPAKAGEFYAEVFGWENDARPHGIYHRMVPGGFFQNKDGTDSQIGNLHFGVFDANNARPHPNPEGVEPRTLATEGRKARIWVLVSDDDSHERILSTAEKLGGKVLWRDHYWKEFNGYNHAFADPWGNEILLWGKAGENPEIPASYTKE
ncbi:catechol 2,3-dioxygenase-like lactoylglutathione lyase family enzyme [Novosphingobium sp. PhB165]|uniref:VOC family protein n=1 Tax=Novosphingobium sp. PhB165 TaxID=2485105 RepID=UPI00104573F3|nr:VOC family protein [Novosphingobium sp. PhB165]TCM17049.1 catechol 2,3-dioxygenase-like lactoylglutathione lyase family enzyme [Novosphingobium sp. PhB165]